MPRRKRSACISTFNSGAVCTPLLSRLLSLKTLTEAKKFLANSKCCSNAQRLCLAELAGLETSWVQCDQAIATNVKDLCAAIANEIYEPFRFYAESLRLSDPRKLFGEEKKASIPLKKKKGFWTALDSTISHTWLPPPDATFDAVVHFVQSGSGTGVHIGGGFILSCAHCVTSRDDDDDTVTPRVGRQRLIVFPSARCFVVECVAAMESPDGAQDIAVLRIGNEIVVGGGDGAVELLPSASVATSPAEQGDRLFCIGNPSAIDLESLTGTKIEFEPPTWHASVGTCEGGTDLGGYLVHSCWTYWGHSGAPLFDQHGAVVGLHCAWDDSTGARHAQKLHQLHTALRAAGAGSQLGGGEAASKGDEDENEDVPDLLPLAERLKRKRARKPTIATKN